MAILGKWIGQYLGEWLGTVDGGGDPGGPIYVDAALVVSGSGSATLSAQVQQPEPQIYHTHRLDWGAYRLNVRATIADEDDQLQAVATIPAGMDAMLAVVDDADTLQAQAFITWPQVEMVIAKARLVRSPKVALIRSRYEVSA